jgi:hypothetical protein
MIGLWTVVGRIILSESFHKGIFVKAKPNVLFEDLAAFRQDLRIANHRILSRWEIMIINEHLTKNNQDPTNPVIIGRPEDDTEIKPIRNGWKGGPPDFQNDSQLCAAVGLCSMDSEYRLDLYNVTDPNTVNPNIQPLEQFLTDLTTETPVFSLTGSQLKNLNNLMQYTESGFTMVELMHNYHIQKWVQPDLYPCNGGYTEVTGTHYIYFAQSALVRFVELEADGKEKLQRYGVQFPV